ncbi:hypothetical protein EJ05DRAFT_480074 [Pseudovirgaria hyperparasitica]|uniref:Uncharacterized protein n=1 Tax=Pseudovirgaria hyperparasitica TaxID=470096 RepID=A0A6A6VWG9_9PEZI|nr:uncharacterized protein EJ05DRAFT_480074 [Pseudovirgaria hyperparasitica]KAF2753581.1 hypothetical protein EJ05DRAFT_480074 [Pseudovirgaria hyperparasitica]
MSLHCPSLRLVAQTLCRRIDTACDLGRHRVYRTTVMLSGHDFTAANSGDKAHADLQAYNAHCCTASAASKPVFADNQRTPMAMQLYTRQILGLCLVSC